MPTRQSHFTEWVMGIAGMLAAGVGTWMYFVPTDWFLGGLAEGWPFGMFIAAGILLTATFGLIARKAYVDDPELDYRVLVPTLLALAAFGAAVTFAVILII